MVEFAITAWCPYNKKDINELEKVQSRATLIPYKNKSAVPYEQRWVNLCLASLTDRRLRGDLIQKYKLENSLDLVNWHHPHTHLNDKDRRENPIQTRKCQKLPTMSHVFQQSSRQCMDQSCRYHCKWTPCQQLQTTSRY